MSVEGMAREDATGGIYSIGAVAKMLGLTVQTLRAWEDRYEQVIPSRSPGGRRLYSREQVDRLQFVCEQVEAGLQPSDAHRLLAERSRERADLHTHLRGQAPGDEEGRVSVLLAERDPYAAEFVDYFLRTEGYAVRIVLQATEARQIIEDEPPTLVVVDLMISGGEGLALCRAARERASIPILAVSAVDSRDEALECGADAFLQKPLEPLQFVSTVRDLVGTSAYLRKGRTALND